jgi:hypothetical protein
MLYLSEVLLEGHNIESFSELRQVISDKGKSGEMFFRMDVKPPYGDTPTNWEEQLESAFTSAL